MNRNHAVAGIAALTALGVTAVLAARRVLPSESASGRDQVVLELDRASNEEASPSEALAPQLSEIFSPSRRLPLRDAHKSVQVVRDWQGIPLAGARVALFAGSDLLATGRTSESGEFAHSSAETSASRLFVLPPAAAAPQVVSTSAAEGRHEVDVPFRGVVSGRLTSSGDTQVAGILLELRSNQPLLPLPDESPIPEEVLGPGRKNLSHLAGTSDEAGSFLFWGLPAQWSGSLHLPEGFTIRSIWPEWLTHSTRSVSLESPSAGLQIEVERLLHIVGRVVETPGGPGVPKAVVRPSLEYGESPPTEREYQAFVLADEDGRFTVSLDTPNIAGGTLSIAPFGEPCERQVQLEPVELQTDLDLGDLPLREGAEPSLVELLVLDPNRSPIPGAVAALDDLASPPSKRTGPSGRTQIGSVVPGVSHIYVAALGFRPAEIHAPAETEQEIVVILEPSTSLEILLRTPEDRPVRKLFASLIADEFPLITGEARGFWRVHVLMGASNYEPHKGQRSGLFTGTPDGRLVFNGIKPGLPLHLRVTSRYGRVIKEQDIHPLSEHESRTETVVIDVPSRLVSGRVVDSAAQPIVDATVMIEREVMAGRVLTNTRGTDSDGVFELGHVFAEHLDLSVSKRGFVTFRDASLEVPPDGSVFEIELAPGHDVEVSVVNHNGDPVEAEVKATLPSGVVMSAEEVAAGTYLLKDLPAIPLEISAHAYQAVHSRLHDPFLPELRIELPLLGKVVATISPLSGVEGDLSLWLLPDPSSRNVPRHHDLEKETAVPLRTTILGVLAGNYVAIVRARSPEGGLLDISEPYPIQILPGQTTRLSIPSPN